MRLLGSDSATAYDQAAAAAMAAISAEGAQDRTVHLSFGDVLGAGYAWQLFADHLIHSWDLARAIGGDDRLDIDLVEACAAWFAAHEDAYRAAGMIGPRPSLPVDYSAQEMLLGGFGRISASAPVVT